MNSKICLPLAWKINKIKIIWFHENPFVLFKVVSPLLSDLLEKWMTFMYQNAHLSHLTGDIYGLNALDASSNISQTHKKEENHG